MVQRFLFFCCMNGGQNFYGLREKEISFKDLLYLFKENEMKRMRLIRDDWNKEDVRYLASLGIDADEGFNAFSVEEGALCDTIVNHFGKRLTSINNVFYAEYSEQDYLESEYFRIRPANYCGYPQPTSDNRYLSISFDESKICSECGCGRIQTDDLRVSKVSKYGFWGFSAWLFDAFFVNDNVYHNVFEPYGLQRRTVRTVKGEIREGVYQLVIPVADEFLNLDGHKYEVCPVCGRKKYTCTIDYPFFPIHERPSGHLFMSKEYFGTGHGAERYMFASKELVDKLLSIKEANKSHLWPCRRDMTPYW